MSSLVLIRHGQASFGAPDYDLLSTHGREQSRLLGDHLARSGLTFDAVYSGPRRRQRDTAELAAAAVPEGLPGAEVLDGLDEFPAFELIGVALPQLAARSPELAALARDPAALTAPRGTDRLLIAVLEAWIDGSLDTHGLESYAAFAARVRAALQLIQAREGRGRRVAVFTSGGPIAQAVMLALELPDSQMIPLANVIGNASITELRYRDGGLSLATFNETPHLHPRQRTQR